MPINVPCLRPLRGRHPGSIPLLLGLLALSWAPLSAQEPLTYNLHNDGAGWPEDARSRIDAAMAEAVALYNGHGYFEKHVTANYNPGVPTAHANYDGWIEFGSNEAFQNTRTALHEISHTLGVGTHGAWSGNRDGNTWTGEHAVRQLGHFDGSGTVLNADTQHFWPYGLNQDSEDGATNRVRHVKIVASMRRDMGIVGTIGGLPADWHEFHLGGSTRIRAGDDTDGDGFTNEEEYLGDTDPADPFAFPGAPDLAYHWPLNETADLAAFARLDPAHEPAGQRVLSASLSATAGNAAVFVKGDHLADPAPLFGAPAAKGDRRALGSTGSLGTASSSGRLELGRIAGASDPFTLSLWFNRHSGETVDGTGSRESVVSAVEAGDGYWHLYATGAGDDAYDLGFFHRAFEGDEGVDSAVATGLRKESWYHLVLMRDDSGGLTVYLDGEPVLEANLNSAGSGDLETGSAAFLGVSEAGDSSRNTVAYWRFEEGPAGANVPVQANAVSDLSGNGNHLRTWSTGTAPAYVNDTPFDPVPASGEANNFALDFSGGNRDVYSDGKPIDNHVFDELTVEASFRPDVTNAWQVIAGKDGNPIGGQPPFSLKVRNDGYLEAAVADGGGTRRQLLSRNPLQAGAWYSAAATVTGSGMALWLKRPEDDGYALEGTLEIDGVFPALDSAWTVGRGMWNGAVTDFFNGAIDEVRVSDVAGRVWIGHDAREGEGHVFPGRFDDIRVFDGDLPVEVVSHLTETRTGMDYGTWADTHFGPEDAADPGVSGPDATPGADGVPNLLRYALGLAPGEPLEARVGPPEIRDGRLRLTYRRDPEALGAVVVVEFSEDLETWRPGSESMTGPDEGGLETVTAWSPDSAGLPVREFVRIRVRSE